MAAIGDVDEANSTIGVALLDLEDEGQRAMLGRIQNELFDLGADLATPGEDFAPCEMTLRIVPEQVARLEREIDAMNASSPRCEASSSRAATRRRRASMSPARWSAGPSDRWSRRGARWHSTRRRWPISTGFRTICSCWPG
jgi:cob(I)alamin adenosyltransferase